jgi:glycosyltransferase involved in cell wall biosynthesis
MKVCAIFYDFQEFGGLEEYATTLAVALKQEENLQVSVLSTAHVDPDNQYYNRLKEYNIPVVQLPKWISLAASDWDTKEKILARTLWFLTPIVYLFGCVKFLIKRSSWQESKMSARNWLQGKLMKYVIGPDRREPLSRLLLKWWQFRWKPDILHIQGYTTNLLFVIDWAYTNKVPTVYEEHQTPVPQFDWWGGFHHIINKADTVLAVSTKSAEGLREVCGVTRPIVVRNPLLVDPLASYQEKSSVAEKSDDSISTTTVGRLSIAKGMPYLLEAICQVKETYPNAHFKVYGDGDMRDELMAQAADLGLNGEDIFVGAFTNRDELTEIMAETDIFVLPSLLEGQPLSIIEATAYGCPIVTTDVGGIPEIIKDGVNGLLCKPKDPGCLADKICLLIDNPDLRERIGKAARLTYEQGPFQPAPVARQLHTIYAETFNQHSLPQTHNIREA